MQRMYSHTDGFLALKSNNGICCSLCAPPRPASTFAPLMPCRACVRICALLFLINRQCVQPEQNSHIQLRSVQARNSWGGGCHRMLLRPRRARGAYHTAAVTSLATKLFILNVFSQRSVSPGDAIPNAVSSNAPSLWCTDSCSACPYREAF